MYKNNIQSVSDAYLCSACGGCKTICGHQAISFRESTIGRRYAVVGKTCTGCGLCRQVCPSLTLETTRPKDVQDKYVGTIKNVYIGRATDNAIYSNAQSGGICTALLTHLFDTEAIGGAIVVRMDYGPVPQVRGVLVTSSQELAATQKSCYTPVDLLSVLIDSRTLRSVAIVGLPCHLEAVENLQRVAANRFANISYRIGLICDRTLCGGIQDVICRYADQNTGVKIKWRDKSENEYRLLKKNQRPFEQAPLVICNELGEKIVLDRYICIVLKDLFTPPRCRICHDKLNIFSDITLGDPWEMSGVDWEHGDNLILTRTEKGENLLISAVECGQVRISVADKEEMLRGQGIDRRRRSVSCYGRAYREMPFALEEASIVCETDSVEDFERERQSLLRFVEHETMTKDMIYSLAIGIIQDYERNQRLSRRIWRKVKKILKRLGNNIHLYTI